MVRLDVRDIWYQTYSSWFCYEPNDHPHGGGEGRAPVGRPSPMTPWGKPAMGLKTRKAKKASNKLIVRRRNGKAIK